MIQPYFSHLSHSRHSYWISQEKQLGPHPMALSRNAFNTHNLAVPRLIDMVLLNLARRLILAKR